MGDGVEGKRNRSQKILKYVTIVTYYMLRKKDNKSSIVGIKASVRYFQQSQDKQYSKYHKWNNVKNIYN